MKNTLKKIFDTLRYRIPAIIIAAAMLAAFVPPIEAKADSTNTTTKEVTFAVIPSGYSHLNVSDNKGQLNLNGQSKITSNKTGAYFLNIAALKSHKQYLGTSGNKATIYRATDGTTTSWNCVSDCVEAQLYDMKYEYYDLVFPNTASYDKYDVYIIPMMVTENKGDKQEKNVSGAVVTVAYPEDGGTTSGDKVSQESVTTTITATPKKGYKFDHWEYMRRDVGNSPSMEVSVDGGYKAYVAIFVRNEDACGAFTTSSGYGTTSGDTYLVDNGTVNASTIINAYPKDNNTVFKYWKRKTKIPSETEYTDDPNFISYSPSLNVNIDRNRDLYTAYFESKDTVAGVFTAVSGNGTTTGDACRYNGQLVDQTTITATPEKDYEFQYWKKDSDTEPFSYLPTINVPVTEDHTTYTAYFVEKKDANGVTTTANPSQGGTTSGDTLRVVNGQKVNSTTIVAYPNDGYVFDHWVKKVGTTETDYSTSASVTVKVDDSKTEYIAYFKTNDNGVTTTASPSEGGTTSGDTLRVVNGQKVNQTTINAEAYDGYVFDHWTKRVGDGKESKFSNLSSVTVNVEDNKTVYTAVFIQGSSEKGVFVQVDADSHGTVSGETARVVNGQKVDQTTLTAYPSSNQWIFDYWTVSTPTSNGEQRISNANPLTVKVTDERQVYTAHFRERGNTTKEKVNITGHSTGATSKLDKTKDREFTSAAVGVDSGIMVAKAGDAVDSSRSRLSSDTARNPVNVGVERLNDTLVVNEKKTSEGLKSEEFRLLAGDGNEIVLENAAASEYENAKAAAEEQVAKKYGQYYKAEVMLVCNTQIPGGYTDGKQTFVWSGTGAKKGERLMIIQQRDDEKDKIITPVADDDGVLTFSASVIGSSRLILVRAVTKK